MTNWDKAKEMMDIEDIKNFKSPFCKAIYKLQGKEYCYCECTECYEWLKQEYKEPPKPILTDKEREYLSAFIKPWRYKAHSIEKRRIRFSDNTEKEFIHIKVSGETIHLPFFEINTMYKGMTINRGYTLQDLGL